MGETQIIPTIGINGKQYTKVKDRVVHFRIDEQYKGWRLVTEPINITDIEAVFVARVYDIEDKLISTGYAHERVGQGMVNKTSHIENCETSAVGRALGFLGIGIVGGIAPADDVEKVVNEEENQISDKQRSTLAKMIQDSEIDLLKFNEKFNIKKLSDLKLSDYNKAVALLNAKIQKVKKAKNESISKN